MLIQLNTELYYAEQRNIYGIINYFQVGGNRCIKEDDMNSKVPILDEIMPEYVSYKISTPSHW